MVEYIKREDAINLLWFFADESCASVVSDFERLPAADVAEVRHGRWMTTDAYPHHLSCSVCCKTYAKNAKWVNELDLPTNYCPNCGAPMTDEALEMVMERLEALNEKD